MPPHEYVLAHELDAAWIIALWLAIHGGDPAPEAIAAQAIAALAPYLGGAQSSLSFTELKSQFANLGIQVTERAVEDREVVESAMPEAISIDQPGLYRHRQYCFQFGGEIICTDLPTLKYRDTAA